MSHYDCHTLRKTPAPSSSLPWVTGGKISEHMFRSSLEEHSIDLIKNSNRKDTHKKIFEEQKNGSDLNLFISQLFGSRNAVAFSYTSSKTAPRLAHPSLSHPHVADIHIVLFLWGRHIWLSSLITRDMFNRMKRQPAEWEIIFVIHIVNFIYGVRQGFNFILFHWLFQHCLLKRLLLLLLLCVCF